MATKNSFSGIAFAVGLYTLCSSSMLLVNKVAVTYLPAPSTVMLLQLLSSAAAVRIFAAFGVVQAEKLEWEKAKHFMIVALAFLGTLYTNMKCLQHANVETFIVFRSSTPIITSVCDYLFLGRNMPNARGWLSLLVILSGAVGYVQCDAGFEVKAYYWVAAWYVVFIFDQLYIKFVCDTVPMSSWGRVYYTNFLATAPIFLLGLMTREDAVLKDFKWSVRSFLALSVSCAAGVGMSYSAFLLRAMVSATYFTVVGIMCKVLTVIFNVLLWDKHATPRGLAMLTICLAAGSMYQQADMRETKSNSLECKEDGVAEIQLLGKSTQLKELHV